jgi:peptidoglycan/xylan/chitin deacetylase (PgdA/CDA1 family)
VDEIEAAREVDEGVLDATHASLDRQLARLRRHCTPIALGDLIAHLDGADLPPNPALVTFDDGYKDNLENALPILKRHGIRATFFIATSFVTERRLFWWDRISWTLKTTRLLDLERFMGDLTARADAPWDSATERGLVDRLIMTWDDVRALRRAGMDVGSHTRSHRVLGTLATEALSGELAGSRADLESALEESIDTIAYPVGPSIAGEPEIRAAMIAARYRLGFTYGTGLQPLNAFDPLDIHRIAPDHRLDDARFSTMLMAPWIED